MAGRRKSARGSKSRAAKQILKSKKRRAKHARPGQEHEPEEGDSGIWIVVVAVVVAACFVAAWYFLR